MLLSLFIEGLAYYYTFVCLPHTRCSLGPWLLLKRLCHVLSAGLLYAMCVRIILSIKLQLSAAIVQLEGRRPVSFQFLNKTGYKMSRTVTV